MAKRSASGGSGSSSARGRGQGLRTGQGRQRPATATTTTTTSATTTVTLVERFRNGRGDERVQLGSSNPQATLRPGTKLSAKQLLASRVYNLSLDVAALQQQVQQLTLHRSLLQTRALFTQRDADASAVKTTAEYWRVFRRGFQATDSRQRAFLEAVTDDGLRLGLTGYGRRELLQQWELYTEYFAIRRYEMHSARVISTDEATGSCITRSDGVFKGSFTRRGLERVFPSVLQDSDLTQRLLGKELVTPVAFVLHFTEDGSILRHDGEVDFFHALRESMGNLTEAAVVMKNARLAAEAMVQPHDNSIEEKEDGMWMEEEVEDREYFV